MAEVNTDSNAFSFDMPPLTPPDEQLATNERVTVKKTVGLEPKPIVDTMDTGEGVVTAQTFVSSQTILDQATPQKPILAVLSAQSIR